VGNVSDQITAIDEVVYSSVVVFIGSIVYAIGKSIIITWTPGVVVEFSEPVVSLVIEEF
jgi:hypothetical protein